MPVKSYAIIANTKSGKGSALRKAGVLEKQLAKTATVKLLPTTHPGSATELAAGAAGSVDRVIAVGGDGTLNEVLNGLVNSGAGQTVSTELGFLPAGTGNAAAYEFNLSRDPVAAAMALDRAETITLDIGMVHFDGGQRAFLLWFGAGWDAVLIHAIAYKRHGRMGIRGLLGKVPRVFSEVARYEEQDIEIMVDGARFDRLASLFVFNIGTIAFGGRLANNANPGDGSLNILALPRIGLLHKAVLGMQMYITGLTRSRLARHGQGVEIELESEGTVPFHVDGEAVGVLPASITLLPGAIRLLKT